MTETATVETTTATRTLIDPLSAMPAEKAEAIRKGVMEGHILVDRNAKVTVRAKSSPTKKDENQPYVAYFAKTGRGMALLCGGKVEPAMVKPAEGKDERTDVQRAPGACDYFNYGFDLDVRQPIRVKLEDSLSGPEKAIDKMVKQLVDGGLFNEPDARAFVLVKRQEQGLPV